jgi:hypothetical protein
LVENIERGSNGSTRIRESAKIRLIRVIRGPLTAAPVANETARTGLIRLAVRHFLEVTHHERDP